MKVFSSVLSKSKFIVLIAFSIFEIISFIIIFFKHKPVYSQIFEQVKELSIKQTVKIANNINEVFRITFTRYFLDLKIVGRHMLFLANDEINPNSKYYKNIVQNEEKQIIYGTIEDIKKNFSEYYDNNTKKFLFFENYIKKYIENKKEANYIDILNNLMNNSLHPELNFISYYKDNGNISDIESNLKKKTTAKYLISILKTNFLNRFLMKREDYELVHYFLLTNDEIYMYPPEAYNNSLIYYVRRAFNCEVSFAKCFYNEISIYTDYVATYTNISGNLFITFPLSIYYAENYYVIICLTIPFEEKLNLNSNDTYFSPKICLELNMTKIFNKRLFENKENYHFIFFFDLNEDLAILYNDNYQLFSDIKTVYNSPKFEKYFYNKTKVNYFYLFQFLYLDLFKDPSLLKENNISLNDIFQEYKIIKDKINERLYIIFGSEDYSVLEVEKTTCKSDIYYNGKKCIKDSILIILYSLVNDYNILNENYNEYYGNFLSYGIYYSMTIIDNDYEYFKWKMNQIIIIKILKLFFFFFVVSIFLIFIYFIFIQIFFELQLKTINQIVQKIKGDSLFEIKDKNEIIHKKEEMAIKVNNKEMLEIKNLFDYLIRTQLLKIIFEQNGHNLNKKITKSEENINNKNNTKVNNNIDSLNDYMALIKNINNEEITIMFGFITAYEHFKKGLYKLSKNEFKDLIKEIQIYESKILNHLENDDSKLKESISRCSKISYLNEYSLTNELSETIINIIKAKLLSQKIYYLYALSLFNQEKIKENKDKQNVKNYKESIKYFIESKKISVLLGLDTIRLIFSLIMISKCYLELKNYKESMININEALLYFTDFRKVIKDKQYFNTKALIFTENYIFQSIILTIAQITYNFNKYNESCSYEND